MESRGDALAIDVAAIEAPAMDPAAIVQASAVEPLANTINTIGKDAERDVSSSVDPVPTPAVRRRTPQAMPARYPAGTIPKATDNHGRALPRAYVAKRRTPSMDVPSIGSGARESITEMKDVPATVAVPATHDKGAPLAPDEDVVDTTPISATSVVDAADRAVVFGESPEPGVGAAPEQSSAPSAPSNSGANNTPPLDSHGAPEPSASGTTMATPASNHGALQILLVAVLLGFALVVLFTLRR
jgi:hypothetical protein